MESKLENILGYIFIFLGLTGFLIYGVLLVTTEEEIAFMMVGILSSLLAVSGISLLGDKG